VSCLYGLLSPFCICPVTLNYTRRNSMNFDTDSVAIKAIVYRNLNYCMLRYGVFPFLTVCRGRDGAYRSWIAKNRKEFVICSGEIRFKGVERPLVYLTSSSGCLHGVGCDASRDTGSADDRSKPKVSFRTSIVTFIYHKNTKKNPE
jgi:hypothetical protein